MRVEDGSGNPIARYGYDPMSRRIWKEQYRDGNGNALAQAKCTLYLYADEGLTAEATQDITLNTDQSVTATGSAQITTQYGPMPNSLIGTDAMFVKTRNTNNADTVACLHRDHLGTPVQATDKAGNVVWAARYEPFGKANVTPAAAANNPTIALNLRLPGQIADEETGLHYNWHRFYDAQMSINNNTTTSDVIQNVGVVVKVTDELGAPVAVTNDPNNLSAKFYIRVANQQNINATDGSGAVNPACTAVVNWLLIPAPGAARASALGKKYYVGATPRYRYAGEDQTLDVSPALITVKPLPLLTLDYLPTRDVEGEDPLTPATRPTEPFALGVRVKNNGYAAAKDLKIDSAQPKTVENNQGLLIGFTLRGSAVNDAPAQNTLPQVANVHPLIRDVHVDLPGRGAVGLRGIELQRRHKQGGERGAGEAQRLGLRHAVGKRLQPSERQSM